MKKRGKLILFAVILTCVIIFIFAYTRPFTIETRYPVLKVSQCTQIRGYYRDNISTIEPVAFVISPDDPHFDELIEIFHSTTFRTTLRNIFPAGTKTHLYSEGDFQWSIMLRFEDVLFPDGSVGNGDMFHIDNFFGDIKIQFDGEMTQCSVKNQEQWLKDVMSIIAQYSN